MLDPRFEAFARLVGESGVDQLMNSRVCVIGLGGVGSWTVEALARCGVGRIDLVDPDDVCVSNSNRQMAALESTLGTPKASVLAARVRQISPSCKIREVHEFVTPSNVNDIVSEGIDGVVDATDRMSVKAAILAAAKKKGIASVTVWGAGGRLDPSLVCLRDLGEVGGDELLRQVRKKLRNDYGWLRGEGHQYGVRAVVSTERPLLPNGCVTGRGIDCEGSLGSAVFVTATFGMFAAREILASLLRPTSNAAGHRA